MHCQMILLLLLLGAPLNLHASPVLSIESVGDQLLTNNDYTPLPAINYEELTKNAKHHREIMPILLEDFLSRETTEARHKFARFETQSSTGRRQYINFASFPQFIEELVR